MLFVLTDRVLTLLVMATMVSGLTTIWRKAYRALVRLSGMSLSAMRVLSLTSLVWSCGMLVEGPSQQDVRSRMRMRIYVLMVE